MHIIYILYSKHSENLHYSYAFFLFLIKNWYFKFYTLINYFLEKIKKFSKNEKNINLSLA